jgi:hypothetical protein
MKGMRFVMKKITAILMALLLVLAFAACVDNGQGDKEGDVFLPSSSQASSTKKTGGFINENGEIELPIDTWA